MLSIVIRGLCLSWVLFITGGYLRAEMWKDASITGILALVLLVLLENARLKYHESKRVIQ